MLGSHQASVWLWVPGGRTTLDGRSGKNVYGVGHFLECDYESTDAILRMVLSCVTGRGNEVEHASKIPTTVAVRFLRRGSN